MNRHHKTPLIAISLAAAMLVAFSCSRHFRQPKPKSWADSLISATLKTDSDDRVLALIDSLEAEGDVSPVVDRQGRYDSQALHGGQDVGRTLRLPAGRA